MTFRTYNIVDGKFIVIGEKREKKTVHFTVPFRRPTHYSEQHIADTIIVCRRYSEYF